MDMQKESQDPSSWLSADQPIRYRSEDLLGRRGFSEALSKAIQRWTGRESLVIALNGAWGSGKSSIKNMLIDALNGGSSPIPIVDFNPWQMANRPSLSEAFFDELGIALGKGDLGTKKKKKAVMNRFRRLTKRLQGGKDLASAIQRLFTVPLIVLGAVAFASSLLYPRIIAVFFAVLTAIAALLANFSRITEAIASFMEAGTEVGQKSVWEIKEELAEDLRQLKTPILIVLDDLDRLTPEEIVSTFQLVKANGDFPNLIYLILCDRKIIEPNVKEALKVDGREYLEKIIQVAFDVPMIDVTRVRAVLFSRLDSFLATGDIAQKFKASRWANLFWGGLHAYFQTLRDVNRFSSTLAFHISYFMVDGIFEVNPVDLIALETLRVFEPDVYRALQASKDLLNGGRPEGTSAKEMEASIKSIIELGSMQRRDELRSIIKSLFPSAEWALGGANYSNEFGRSWYQELRICSPKMFDRYFRLSASDDEISQAEVAKLRSSRGDREQLSKHLQIMYSRGLLNLALDELGIYQDELTAPEVEAYITAILDISDRLSDSKRGMFELPMSWRVASLIQRALEKLEIPAQRAAALISAIEHSNSVGGPIEVAAILCDRPDNDSDPRIFNEADSQAVRDAVVRKIRASAETAEFNTSPKLAMILSMWRKWGDAEEVSNYVQELIGDREAMLQLLKSLVVRSMRQQFGDYSGTERHFIQRRDVEPLISMDALKTEVDRMGPIKDDPESARALECFNKAFKRYQSNAPDDGPFIED